MASDQSSGASDDLPTAIGEYVLGEISLGKAAERAGLTRWRFEEVLEEAGFTALYRPRTREELDDELEDELDVVRDVG